MPPDRRQRFVRNIIADTGRMQSLVDRLLLLARLDNPTAANEPVRDISLRSLLRELSRAPDERVEVQVEGEPRVRMVESHLNSVVGNLVDNALASQARGSEPERPVEVYARIFERFFTTDRESGGTGPGLPIVRAIAEYYRGRVELDMTKEQPCLA